MFDKRAKSLLRAQQDINIVKIRLLAFIYVRYILPIAITLKESINLTFK